MTDPDALLDALDAVHSQRGGSFVIVATGDRDELYVQFAAPGEAGLYAEVVGNAYLPIEHRLTLAQQSAMREQGWEGDGEENWGRSWSDASSPEARQRIVYEALRALGEVYGATGDVRVVEVELDDPNVPGGGPEPAGPASTRAVLLISVALALLVLGIAIAAAVLAG